MKIDEQKVLARMANDDRSVLDYLYKEYREPFLSYFKKYSISEEELKDLYQDTMIAFYQNGARGKLKTLKSSMKTYVFGIGKHKAVDLLRKKSKTVELDRPVEGFEEIDFGDKELTTQQKKLKKYFAELGESCRNMLIMFYYRGLDISDIVVAGGYKDANSVKSHKSRCVKQLRSLINK